MTEKDGEKKIEDMDSGEFIAHVFYNVLGGLHANEEIDARLGILDMVEDIKQGREELRTRNAELEKDLEISHKATEAWGNQCSRITKERDELHTRVEELEKDERVNDSQYYRRLHEQSKARVAEIEKNLADVQLTCRMEHDRTDRLQARLSTLLKASEGMEKALNEIADMAFFWERLNKQDGGSRKGTKYEELATQALADFRAVKEHNEIKAKKEYENERI